MTWRISWRAFTNITTVGLAAFEGHEQVLQAFIDAESLYDETNHIVGRRRHVQFEFDNHDESPLAFALKFRRIEIIKMIVATGFIAPSLEWFLDAIHLLEVRSVEKYVVDALAAMYDNWKIDPSLVETLRRRLVPEVVCREDPLCLQFLLERQLFNTDALHEGLWLASREGSDTIVKMISLIDGVDVNARTPDGHTSLCIASARGYSRVVQALLATHKADVNAKCVLGMAPLHLAIDQPESSEHDYPGQSCHYEDGGSSKSTTKPSGFSSTHAVSTLTLKTRTAIHHSYLQREWTMSLLSRSCLNIKTSMLGRSTGMEGQLYRGQPKRGTGTFLDFCSRTIP